MNCWPATQNLRGRFEIGCQARSSSSSESLAPVILEEALMSVIEADNMIDTAKASILAYNYKDWQKAKESLRHDAVYDEKATHRRIEGRDDIITAWRGWGSPSCWQHWGDDPTTRRRLAPEVTF
jgi:hypothetical protein